MLCNILTNYLLEKIGSLIKTLNFTEYSWEFEGYKYSWKEATSIKSSYKDSVEFCKSQGGELPYFEAEKESIKKSV